MSSVEQITDGMVRLIQKNVVARTPLAQDFLAGQGVVTVDNTFRFEDGNEVLLVDGNGLIEYHVLLKKLDTNHLQLLQPAASNFLVSNNAIVQKSVAWVPLYENTVFFGDREVLPTVSASVTVDPQTMANEWIYLPGGLNEDFRLQIMTYVKLDETEQTQRAVLKYADNIFRLTTGNIHLDIVMDEQYIVSDLAAGCDVIPLPTTVGWPPDPDGRYEVQDNNNVEIDFNIVQTFTSPPGVQISRRLTHDYRMADFAKFRRRVVYTYESLADNIEFGSISKGSTMFKAAKISWHCKETEEWRFPQQGRG